MAKKRSYMFVNLVVWALFLAGCSLMPWENNAGQPVTFVIPIDVSIFSPNATLTVHVWTGEQIESGGTGACTVTYDALTQKETVECPEEVAYQEVTPETFTFSINTVHNELTINSQVIFTGDEYHLQVTGLSSDNCNQASAGIDGKAKSAKIIIKGLQWMQTEMACP